MPALVEEGCPLASSPGLPRGEGKGRPGIHYMHMRCYYSDWIAYGYCLVYLPFDLNASCSTYLVMVGLDSSKFERDFEVARATLFIYRQRPLNSVGTRLAWSLVQRSGGHSVFFRHMDRFTCQHVVEISVRTLYGKLYGKCSACACSGYQAFLPPPPSEGLGTRLV